MERAMDMLKTLETSESDDLLATREAPRVDPTVFLGS
jgi:hypothetical protein